MLWIRILRSLRVAFCGEKATAIPFTVVTPVYPQCFNISGLDIGVYQLADCL